MWQVHVRQKRVCLKEMHQGRRTYDRDTTRVYSLYHMQSRWYISIDSVCARQRDARGQGHSVQSMLAVHWYIRDSVPVLRRQCPQLGHIRWVRHHLPYTDAGVTAIGSSTQRIFCTSVAKCIRSTVPLHGTTERARFGHILQWIHCVDGNARMSQLYELRNKHERACHAVGTLLGI